MNMRREDVGDEDIMELKRYGGVGSCNEGRGASGYSVLVLSVSFFRLPQLVALTVVSNIQHYICTP